MPGEDKPLEEPVHSAELAEAALAADASQNEVELVQAAKALDASAWSAIYQRHYRQVYGYIFFRTHDREQAEDLTADVFVRALRGIGGYSYRGTPLLAWLYRIARNVTADHRKAMSRRAGREAAGLEGEPQDAADVIGGAVERVDMRAAIAGLTDEQQQVVLLRFYERMSAAEVAMVMGKTEGAVKALQARALNSLRRRLSDQSRGDGAESETADA